MIKSLLIDTLSKKLLEVSNSGELQAMRSDIEKNIKAVIESALTKFDIVSRQEYDQQVELLTNSRIKLDAMEKEIARLSAQLDQLQQADVSDKTELDKPNSDTQK